MRANLRGGFIDPLPLLLRTCRFTCVATSLSRTSRAYPHGCILSARIHMCVYVHTRTHTHARTRNTHARTHAICKSATARLVDVSLGQFAIVDIVESGTCRGLGQPRRICNSSVVSLLSSKLKR